MTGKKLTGPMASCPDLAGVSETMLWSLHNRASEAMRPDRVLVDPQSVHIQSAINHDFAGHFGVPMGSLAARAVEIDRALRSWIERHPEGIIVSLGETSWKGDGLDRSVVKPRQPKKPRQQRSS